MKSDWAAARPEFPQFTSLPSSGNHPSRCQSVPELWPTQRQIPRSATPNSLHLLSITLNTDSHFLSTHSVPGMQTVAVEKRTWTPSPAENQREGVSSPHSQPFHGSSLMHAITLSYVALPLAGRIIHAPEDSYPRSASLASADCGRSLKHSYILSILPS